MSWVKRRHAAGSQRQLLAAAPQFRLREGRPGRADLLSRWFLLPAASSLERCTFAVLLPTSAPLPALRLLLEKKQF